MAAPKFNTNVIQQNTPGLTYATPKAMPAKFNNFGAAVKMSDTFIKEGVKLDKSLTLNEVDAAAKDLADEYRNNSITNQSFLFNEAQEIQNNMNVASDEEKLEYQVQLDEVMSKLNNAKTQGRMTPEEFKMRVMQKTNEISNNNPAYADEIAAKMNKVMGNTGTNDLLTMDSASYKAQADARAAEIKIMNTQLTEWGYATVGIDDEQRYADYIVTSQLEREYKMSELLVNRNLQMTEAQKLNFQSSIEAKGGIEAVGSNVWQGTYLSMKRNMADTTIGNEEKYLNHLKMIADAEAILDNTLALLPANPRYTKYFDRQIAKIDKLKVDAKDLLDGSYDAKYWQNKANSVSNKDKYEMFLDGMYPERLAYVEKQASIMEKLQNNTIYRPNDAQAKMMTESITKVFETYIGTDGKKSNPNLPSVQELLKGNLIKSIPMVNKESMELLKDGENLGPIGGYFNDLFLQNEVLTGNKRISDLDQRLRKMSYSINPEVFEDLLVNNSDFKTSSDNALSFYQQVITQEISQIAAEESTVDSFSIQENGIVNVTSQSPLLPIIPRLNTYIQYKAKTEGLSRKEAAKKYLTEDFFSTSTPVNEVRTWTLEEARAAPEGSVDDNDLVIDENGNARRSGE